MGGFDVSGTPRFKPKSKLLENILSLFILQGANYLLPLIAVPYLVRVLGPSDYGRLAFAQAFVMYFVIFVDYGFDLSATRQVATLIERAEPIAEYVSSVLVIKITLAILGFGIVLFLVRTIPDFEAYQKLVIISYINVVGTVVFPIWLYRGFQAMKAMTIYTVAARAASVVAIFIFVRGQDDLLRVALIQASVLLVAGIPALILAPRIAPLKFSRPKLRVIRCTLVDGWHAFLSTAALTLYTSTNVLILGLITTPAVVGYYSAAYKLITAASGLISPLSQAVYPHIVALAATSRTAALSFVERLFWFQSCATLLLSLGLFVFSSRLIQIILGPQYHECTLLLRIMAGVPFIVGNSNLFGIQTMMVFEMKRAFSRIIIGCGVLNIAFLLPLVHLDGAVGAAVAVLIVEVVAALAMAWHLHRSGILLAILDPRPALVSLILMTKRAGFGGTPKSQKILP